ncbi:Hypothetical protein NGAL_HAMBI2605_56350 [Neorhizobium galegae bv. orientalis]|nr:Hypothetical protein NGAL_HAMBI2605_56350 [Neorhizobium galegae bv. orientalis]
MNFTETSSWVSRIIKDKANYDIIHSDQKTSIHTDQYITDNGYLVTVQLRSTGRSLDTISAQKRIDDEFGRYHASVLRRQCFQSNKINRRHKRLQPLAFIAFDIEGSRHNGFSFTTRHPHGHGVMLFHERTLADFKVANAKFQTLEGGFKIINPTPAISLIDLKPIGSATDLSKWLRYSLKLERNLQNSTTSYAPYNFYPHASVDFPFWGWRPDTLNGSPTSLAAS